MRRVFFVLGFLLMPFILWGYLIPRNFEVRLHYRDILSAPIVSTEGYPRCEYTTADGEHRVRFELREQAGFQYLLFINEQNYRFPLFSPGSWIIKKNPDTGRILQIKIFLGTDEENCIRLMPAEDRTRLNVYLFGEPVYREFYLPLSLDRAAQLPLDLILGMTEESIDWDLFFPDDFRYEWDRVETFYRAALEASEPLEEAWDGAMNTNGEWVRIETLETQQGEAGLNCSGFAKWLGDAFYRVETGHFMAIEPLKEKPLDLRGNRWSLPLEEARDPFFGLDWTRNIAVTLQKLLSSGYTGNAESADVDDLPFYFYYEDVGYPVAVLRQILYLLAVTEPGHFYLATFSHPWDEEGGRLRQYTHVSAFFPWMDDEGNFHAEVMETNLQTGLDYVFERFPESYVHLVRISAEDDFLFGPVEDGSLN